MPRVFADWRCSQAILDSLAHTEVGRSYPKPSSDAAASDTDADDGSESDDRGAEGDSTEVDVTESSYKTDNDGPEADVEVSSCNDTDDERSSRNTEEDSSVMGKPAGPRPS